MQEYSCSLCLAQADQHTGMIYSVNFSSDEKHLLTHSTDGTARVWNVQTGELKLTIPVYQAADRLCCFSPCGELLLSSTTDREGYRLTLLKAADGSTVAIATDLFADQSPLRAACFSPDGSRVAVGSEDSGGVRIFGVPGLQLLSTLPRREVDDYEAVHSLQFAPDGAALLLSTNKCVEVWDVTPGADEPTRRHTLRDTWAYHPSLSPDGKFAAAGERGGHADVWDLASGSRVLQVPAAADGPVCFCCWLPSGDVIVTGTRFGVVRFWSFSAADPASSGQPLGSVDVFGDRVCDDKTTWDFCLSPSGSLLACGGQTGGNQPFVKVFRAPTLSPLQWQLGDLLRSKRGADVSLACGDTETPAHSLILAMRSGTLQRQLDWGAERRAAGAGAALSASGGGTAADRMVRLEMDASVEPAILERLLEYLYTDHLVIQSAEEAQHLLHAASFYDVPGLFHLSAAALEKRLAVENVVETLIAADKHGAATAGLKLAAMRFLKVHAEDVVFSTAWRRLPRRLADEFVFFQSSGKLAPPAAFEAAAAEEEAGEGGAAAAGGGRNVRQRTT